MWLAGRQGTIFLRHRIGKALAGFLPADGPLADSLHICVMCTLAVAQPLWSLVGESGEFFLARNADMAEVALAAVAVVLGPPALLLGLQWAVSRFGSTLRRSVHRAQLAGLALLILTRVLARVLADPPWLVMGLAAAGAAVVLAAIVLTKSVRWTLSAFAPLPLLLLVLFLFASEAGAVIAPAGSKVIKGPVHVSLKAPVLLLVFDEFPGTSIMDKRLEIDAARAPNMAAFARQATWYSNATTVHDVTDMAVPSILTGNRTSRDTLPVAADYPVNLFSLLGKAGYEVRADEYLTRLCPPAYCARAPAPGHLLSRVRKELLDLAVVYGHEALPSSMTRRLPQIDGAWGNFLVRPSSPRQPRARALRGVLGDAAVEQASRINQLIHRVAASNGPTVNYLHVSIPHAPFAFLPNGRAYMDTDMPGLNPDGTWDTDEFLTDQAQQRLLLQVGYADYQFGRVLDALHKSGRFDDTLVAVVSDHGSANLPGVPRRAFSRRTFGEVASVPLMIKLPGQTKGRTVHKSAETVDILPTIAEALGFQIPGPVEGQSLLRESRRPRVKRLTASTGERYSIPPGFPQRRSTVARDYGRFALQGESFNLFASGPYRSLVGQQVPGSLAAGSQLTAVVDKPEALRGTTPPEVSASHIVGRLSGLPQGLPPGDPVDLLIAVEGRFVATSRSFEVQGDKARLSIFVPDDALAGGGSGLEIFAVTGPGDRPRLVRVPWS